MLSHEPLSFSDRRPNAPSFELPPPSLAYPSTNKYGGIAPTPTSQALTSVGNLLTPPQASHDALSSTAALAHGSAMWPSAPSNSGSSYSTFHPNSASFAQRPLYSPSLRTSPPPPPPQPYDLPPYATSLSLSMPAMQSLASQQMPGHMTSSTSQPSPPTAFARAPPTPNYYPQSSTHHHHFHNAGAPRSPPKMSPTPLYNQAHYSPQRAPSYPSYPMLGAHVLSQLPNQHGPTAFYGGVPGGVPSVMPSFHPEQQHMPHIYGAPQSNPQNERPFRCDQCPQSFNRNHDLKRHKRIHLAVKPFPCGHCDKSFSRKDALKRHVLVKGCGKSSNHATIKDSSNNSPGSRTRSTPVGT